MEKESKIFIAGINGMVGSAIKRTLLSQGYNNIIGWSSKEYDLRKTSDVEQIFLQNNIDYVFICAAKVGGILSNSLNKGEFIYDNLMIQTNIIECSRKYSIKKLLFLGSSCVYPKECLQPIKEEYLLSGILESTNDAYAIAKIAGIKMCESYNIQYGTDYVSVMPCNLYGLNDNYNLNNSHVLPALINKIHNALINDIKHVSLWGSGKPMREFLYVDDLAEACILIMNSNIKEKLINIGSSEEISIYNLAIKITDIIGYKGTFEFDSTKPDGTMRKVVDSTIINSLGWQSKTNLDKGIKEVYKNYIV